MVNISFDYVATCIAMRSTGLRIGDFDRRPHGQQRQRRILFPTDLVATALGTCISTTMALAAQPLGVDLKGMTVNVSKEMSKDAPRRIVSLPAEVHIPLPATLPQRALLESVGLNCPVHKSLPAEIERPTKFFWEG